jgi:integrative and conjugative element protein (TIGR02256 family)
MNRGNKGLLSTTTGVPWAMSDPVIILDSRAQALIAAETALHPKRETGGALFGFLDGNDVVVSCAYGPGPRAKHRRASFEPHPDTTAALMKAVRGESEARYRYLGSWHSHPGGPPRPSGRDIATTAEVASDSGVLLPNPVMMIQAAGLGNPTRLRAWRWDPQSDWLYPCPIEVLELKERFCPVVPLPRSWHRRPLVMHPTACHPAGETEADH